MIFNFKLKNIGKEGFTLIELLVVISIIGLLSSVVVASLKSARLKAKDAVRLSDINQIILALELYRDTYGQYPEEAHSGCYDGWETTCDSAGNFIDVLRTSGFMSKVPLDPVNQSSGYGVGYFYSYYRYDASYAQSIGCPFNSAFAVITINQFEASNLNAGKSAKCTGRNWYPEFDYSVMLPE